MSSEEPDPGGMYTIQARQQIAALQKARRDTAIKFRWYPSRKGAPGNGELTSGRSWRRKIPTPAGSVGCAACKQSTNSR